MEYYKYLQFSTSNLQNETDLNVNEFLFILELPNIKKVKISSINLLFID